MTREEHPANGRQTVDGLWALQAQNLTALNQMTRNALEQAEQLVTRWGSVVSDTNRQLAVALWRSSPMDLSHERAARSFRAMQQTVDASFVHTLALAELATKAQLESLSILRQTTLGCLNALRFDSGEGSAPHGRGPTQSRGA